nr:hypothetical protein [Tanacetum cinerariifolium]
MITCHEFILVKISNLWYFSCGFYNECGDPLDGIFCKRYSCKSCGKDAHIGYNCPSKVLVISNPEPCNNQTIDELPQTLPSFHPTFQSEADSPFTLDSTSTYVDESPNVFNPPPQPLVNPCEFCGNNAYYGHYCTPQAPFIHPKPCYNQDFTFSTLAKIKDQMTSITSLCELACQVVQKKREEKQIEEERAAKAQTWKLSDDDDDEERSDSLDDNIISGLLLFFAITPDEPVLSIEEPDNSLSMGDEHLDTILATKSDGIENLIPIPSESKGIPERLCDVLSHDNSPPLDVSNDIIEDLSESNKEFSSTNDDSFSINNIDYVEASPPDSELVSPEVTETVIPGVGRINASNENPIPSYDPIIPGNPPNLTPSRESDFFLEVDAFLAVEDESTSSQFPKSTLAKITEQMTSITSLCEMACQIFQKNLEEKQLEEERAAKAQNWKLPVCYDDDNDRERSDSLDDNIISGLPSSSAITPDEPILSIEEPDNSLSMGDEHLDTIPATESDEFIKSDQIEDFFESNEEFSLTDNYSFSFDKIDYVKASLPDSKLVSSEVMEIVTPEVGGIKASSDNPILFYDPIISGTPPNLTPSGESDFFLEGDMFLFEAFLSDDHSSDFKTKPSSTSLNSLLEETNNFNKSLPEFTAFSKVLFDAECESDSSDDQSCFDEDVLEKIILKPLCEEEIIPMKSLRTHDSFLPISSKIDSLLDEFVDELTLLKSISPGIDETDCDFEEDI